MTSAAMISTPQPEASETGVEILRRGGNAVDAAIAAALVQGVVDPQMCGIAGFGSLQLYLPAKGFHGFIDFHGRTPAAARPDMWQDLIEGETRDGFGFLLKGRVNDAGYQSITVPGSLKAYFEAQTAHGVMDWADVVQPAIEQAEAGAVIRPHVHFFWTEDDGMGRVVVSERLAMTPAGRRIYFRPDGSLKGPGERLDNPDLARTLRLIAREGADVFYLGEIAERIEADMKANGGLLSTQDLKDYRTRHVEPLWGRFRDFLVASNQPPGGGVMLIEMLQILEHFDLRALGHNSADYLRVVCEAMKRATSDKDDFVGDPAFFEVPLARLTDPAYARELAGRIEAGEVAHVERYGAGGRSGGGQPESKNTTQVSVADAAGNLVSMTHSLGMPSGVVTEGLGFMYNGCMGVFDPRPGRANSIAPGKARFSSICPSLVFRGEEPRLVIGAPGGTQIAMGVLQATLNVLEFGMPILEAICAPRFSATSDAIDVTNRIPRFVTRALEARGYRVERSHLSYGIAAVHGLERHADGSWSGAADPGHDGMALGVEG
ncbi:MAG: gamma-glutamyltransferase [Tistlia sp.]|uniref:gamma-glutamyltransferase n=1 Tax=Tistlia sp. TaxID=3057121 RepID=UPI0034A418B7